MLCVRTLFSVALLVPFLATLLPAQAAKMDVRAARAECFRKANEAANAARVNLVPAVLLKGRLLEWTPTFVLSQTRHTAVDNSVIFSTESPPSGVLSVDRRTGGRDRLAAYRNCIVVDDAIHFRSSEAA